MKFNKFVFLIILVITSLACRREIELNIDYDNLIVINGLLVADSSPIEITLTKTRNFSDDSTYSFINEASVQIFCNDTLLSTCTNSDSGKFISNITPKAGNTYKVIAYIKGYDSVWAETTIPKQLNGLKFSADSINRGYQTTLVHFFCEFSDDINQDNYYWLWSSNKYIYTTNQFVDELTGMEFPFREWPYNKVYRLLRFADSQFNGNTIELDLLCSLEKSRTIYFNSFDKNYDQYLSSYISYSNYAGYDERTFLWYQPSFIHSNINNGTGIFGSMVSYNYIWPNDEK